MKDRPSLFLGELDLTNGFESTNSTKEQGSNMNNLPLTTKQASSMVLGSVKYASNDKTKEKYTTVTNDIFKEEVIKIISAGKPVKINLNAFDLERLCYATKGDYVSCDNCEKDMFDGWYHEDSGIKVCSEECGREQFEDFVDRINDTEDIMYTTFEYW